MCIQPYERYNLCPCELKRGTLLTCPDPYCRTINTPVYNNNKSYCAYHARKAKTAIVARNRFLSRKGVRDASSLNISSRAPILGRVSSAFAGSKADFPGMCTRYGGEGMSDEDSDGGRFAGRKEEFWAMMEGAGRGYGARLSKTSECEKSRTWVEWKKFQRAKKKAGEGPMGMGDQGLKVSELETNSAKEESQMLSTSEVEEIEVMGLSKSHTVTPDPKPQNGSPSRMTEFTKHPELDGT
ncbi:uncharacterized protein GGS22DRAFT_191489 [Annulohypoxylon maeteangense]|uniref:uncharacterized protein n=1 Tax=Annulohypoxylon maeteangense TaxID=1927788 RepID=UPI002007CEA2|nr:uncharacterized protein GGS22DRAFT_191489 [Annulohypoxylon maeteangense]KAI0882318.1 hypothetical protein GGS22DRAFT_191489 [Annulohypoxylon maeteangense]